MAKSMLLLALCVLLPALISGGRLMSKPFVLEGRVYCDTCRAGFETSATTYIPRMLSISIIFINLYYKIIVDLGK